MESNNSLRVSIEEIEEAYAKISSKVICSPLVRLNTADKLNVNVYLKLENLQPVGSFKIRGAWNRLLNLPWEVRQEGVCTASKGNFGHALGWCAKQLNIPCTVVVPENAPKSKVDAMKAVGCQLIEVPLDAWFRQIFQEGSFLPGIRGTFIHPAFNTDVIAGNGTIACEIYKNSTPVLENIQAIMIPCGGGGLATGIATYARKQCPRPKCFIAEPVTAAPVHAAFINGFPTECNFHNSFIDGAGAKIVAEKMWGNICNLIQDSIVVTLDEVKSAIKLLAQNHHVIVEGAGALSLAAALKIDKNPLNYGLDSDADVVCIISGGCIDTDVFCEILTEK